MQIKLLISLIFSFLIGILALQNTQSVEVNFLFLNFKFSMTVLILAIVISGILIAVGFGVFKEIKYKKIIRAKNKNITKLKKEISAINGSFYGQNIHTKSNAKAYDNITSLLSIKSESTDDFLSELKKQANVETALSPSDNKDIKKDDVVLKSNQNSDKNLQDTMRISNLLSGFDDLEDDDFSIKNSTKKLKNSDDWFIDKNSSKSREIIDQLLAKKEKKPLIDLKSSYSDYISDVSDNIKNTYKLSTKKKYIPRVTTRVKKFKRIQKSNLKKINSEKTFLKSLLNDEHIKALDELSTKNTHFSTTRDIHKENLPPVAENSCSIVHLYKQNTDPNRTLSTNLVKERFNWKSDIYTQDIDLEEIASYNSTQKNIILNKINSLFSIGDK